MTVLKSSRSFGTKNRVEGQLLHTVQSSSNGTRFHERSEQPRFEEPRSHRRFGTVEDAEETALATAVREGADQLQVALGDGIQDQVVGFFLETQARNVVDLPSLSLLQILEGRTGGGHGQRPFPSIPKPSSETVPNCFRRVSRAAS